MFTSQYHLVQEPDEAGISISYFTPRTPNRCGIIRTPVPVSSELVTLFNGAPQDDQAAYEWGIRADARGASKRLFQWLRTATSTDDLLRFAPVIQELARRSQEAFAAANRLGKITLRNRNTPEHRGDRRLRFDFEDGARLLFENEWATVHLLPPDPQDGEE
jgi:hypothetical protein